MVQLWHAPVQMKSRYHTQNQRPLLSSSCQICMHIIFMMRDVKLTCLGVPVFNAARRCPNWRSHSDLSGGKFLPATATLYQLHTAPISTTAWGHHRSPISFAFIVLSRTTLLQDSEPVTSLACSIDGKYVFAASRSLQLRCLDAATGRHIKTFKVWHLSLPSVRLGYAP
jgi:hypothetical protein